MSKFKVGDKVILENDLAATVMSYCEKENIYFVAGNNWSEWCSAGELKIPPKTLKEKYMVTGNVFECEDKERFLIVGDLLYGNKIWDNLNVYDDNMKTYVANIKRDIVKVYRPRWAHIDKALLDSNLIQIWERPQEIELTDFEKQFLSKLDDTWKWIARDRDGDLYVYKTKPELIFSVNEDYYENNGEYEEINLRLFDSTVQLKAITFESGVHLISDLIK